MKNWNDDDGASLDQEPISPDIEEQAESEPTSVPWVKVYPDRHMADVADFSMAETAAYFRLLFYQMQYGNLPREEAKLRRIARLGSKEWTKCLDALSEKFGPEWRHERVASDRDAAVAAVRQKREAGRLGGQKRGVNLRVVR